MSSYEATAHELIFGSGVTAFPSATTNGAPPRRRSPSSPSSTALPLPSLTNNDASPPTTSAQSALERWLGDPQFTRRHATVPSARVHSAASSGMTVTTNNNSSSLDTMANLATANALATTERLNAQLFQHMSSSSTNNHPTNNNNISSPTRSSFTPTSSTTTTSQRQQQRLRDYQRQQQQQQLRNYERQHQQRLRSNLITAASTARTQQHHHHHRHPYLPRTSRSSMERTRSLQGLRQRRLQQQRQQLEEEEEEERFSMSGWNEYQSARAELNERSTALEAAAEAATEEEEVGGNSGGGGGNGDSAQLGGFIGEEEEELRVVLEGENNVGVAVGGSGGVAARPMSSESGSTADDDSSSMMPDLEPLDQEGEEGNVDDGGSPSTRSTTTSTTAAAASSSSASASNNGTSTTPPQLPTRRSRRQAAVRGMERISAAIATAGMGNDYNNTDDSTKLPLKQSPSKKPAGKPSTLFSKTTTCCICLEVPTEEELSIINGCDHPYCFTCIETWANRENTCPLCKARFTKIEKVNFNKSKRKRGGGESGANGDASSSSGRKSKRVRTRNQRADINLVNPLQGLLESIEASGALPTQIAQLLFSGLGGSSFGSRHRSSSATAAAASSATSRSAAATAASTSSSRPTPPPSRWPTGPMEDFLAATSMALPPIMDPFGLSTLPTGSFGGPPSPWNSSTQSSSASPFSFRSAAAAAASRERSQPAPAAASSPFGSYSGPSFDGFSSRHEDDFFRSLSSLSSPPRQHSSQSRRSTRHDGLDFGNLDYDGDFRREMHPYIMTTRMRSLEQDRREGVAAPSSRSGNRATRPSSHSGTNNRAPAPPFAAAAAGTSRETALEIYDSDDDEEVVEVIDLVS